MQVEELLEQSAKRFPDKVALVCQGRRLTYREIDRQCDLLAAALVLAGVQRGDRVAIYMDSSVEAVLSIFAVLKVNAVFVPINSTSKPTKLAGILNDGRVVLVVTQGDKLQTVRQCWDDVPSLKSVMVSGSEVQSEETPAGHLISMSQAVYEVQKNGTKETHKGIDIDLAAVIYTSGSTGKPRGVMLTHLNMNSAVDSITSYIGIASSDVILSVLPLSHGYGLNQLFLTFKSGGTLVLEPGFGYPAAVLNLMQQEKVTGFPLVPTIAALLLQMDLSKYDLSALRYITNAAAALPVEHIRRLRQILPHIKIFSMYGLTECTRVTYLHPDQIDSRPASVGRGMENQEIYIVDEQGRRLGPNLIGELVVRGSHVMMGYWGLSAETEEKLKPGAFPGDRVLYTGDLFKMDDEGYLYFVSRKDDIIKVRGEKVSPREVEDILYELNGIAEAAVIGVQDAVLGQAIKAIVTLREDSCLTQREVQRHCASRLEDFMIPKFVEVRKCLPKTHSGKIQKHKLQSPEILA